MYLFFPFLQSVGLETLFACLWWYCGRTMRNEWALCVVQQLLHFAVSLEVILLSLEVTS